MKNARREVLKAYGYEISDVLSLISNINSTFPNTDIAVSLENDEIIFDLFQLDMKKYKELIDNGYTKNEIFYLNYLVLYYSPVPKSILVGNSIVEEKIATKLCETLINSEETHNENIYELIRKILKKYDVYQIKCCGYSGIKKALEYKIDIVNPITFVELYYDLDENLYSFNILNKKWDLVANKMNSSKYQKLFDKFLLVNSYNKKEIEECINRYNILTNKNYIDSFLVFDVNRIPSFNLLVYKGVILLKDIYERNMKVNPEKGNEYLKDYIKEINNKKSFDFLKYILRLHKYNMKEINNIGFSFETLIRGYRYYYEGDSIYLNIKEVF